MSLFWFMLMLMPSCLQTALSPEKNLIWSVKAATTFHPGLSVVSGDPAAISGASAKVQTINLRGQTALYSVCPDYHTGVVYVADLRERAFHQLNVSNLMYRRVHLGVGDSQQMALDWANGNLYWVDGLFGWIAVKSLNKSHLLDYKVLVEKDVDFPLAIAVDPTRGYLFWSEVGRTQLIKRASLGGASPEVIVVDGLFSPRALTIDINTGRIYWVDRLKETVEYCDSDGQNRKVLLKLNSAEFYGIAYYKNLLFVADHEYDKVLVLHSTSGSIADSIDSKYGSPRSIAVYAEENQPALRNRCRRLACEHFCVNDNAFRAKCLCQDGFTLSADERSCTGSTVYSPRMITFANKTHVCVTNITVTQLKVAVRPFCPVSDGVNITAVSADSGRRRIFYADKGRQQISGFDLNTGSSSVIVTSAGTVEGLSYDWLTDTVYWIDSGANQIRSYAVGSGGPSTVVISSTNAMGPLTLDPFTRQIFWISRSPAAIKSAPYDSPQSVKTLVSTSINNQGGIHCDPVKQKIFWTDGGDVKSAYTNGTGDRIIINNVLHNNNRGLVVHKEMVLWTSHAHIAFINSGNLVHKVHSTYATVASQPLVDLDMIDNYFHQQTRGACFQNGGCDHYCLPTEGATRECRCELGFELQADGQTCSTEFLSTDHFLLADLTAGRFYQVDINTGKVRGSFRPQGHSPTLAVNPEHSVVYWSDFGRREIHSSYLNGTNMKTVPATGKEFASRLEVDEVTGNIFFSANSPDNANGTSYIGVVTPDGKSKKKLIKNLNRARAVGLYSSKGLMFWTDVGASPHVGRANMDGSERQTIIKTEIEAPNGIAIDFEEDRLFWSDGFRDVIERCTLFGADRRILVKDPAAFIMALVIHGDKLYYTAWNKGGITVVNKADGSNQHFVMESPVFAELGDFLVVRPNKGNPVSVINRCSENNGGCSALCLPTPIGRTCACADRVSLEADGRTCVGDLRDGAVTSRKPSPNENTGGSGNTVVVVASITSGTIIVLAILVAVIVLVVRKRRRQTVERSPQYNVRYVGGPEPVSYLTPADCTDGYCTPTDYMEPHVTLPCPPAYSLQPEAPRYGGAPQEKTRLGESSDFAYVNNGIPMPSPNMPKF